MEYKSLVHKKHDVLRKYPESKRVDITFSSTPVRRSIVCRSHSFSSQSNVPQGFPARSSTYINTFKSNQRVNSATRNLNPILDERKNKNKVQYTSPRFPITYPDRDSKIENWWRIVSDDDKPMLKILNISPFIVNSPQTTTSHAKQFQKRHFGNGVKGKMFLDHGKVLYFRNTDLSSRSSLTKENTFNGIARPRKHQISPRSGDNKSTGECHCEGRRKLPSQSSFRLRRLLSGPQVKDSSRDNINNEFMRTNSKAELHTKSFFLRTPEVRKDDVTCGCHLCAYERDLALSQTVDGAHGIIYTISSHSKPNKFGMPYSQNYPPGRPNTALCQ